VFKVHIPGFSEDFHMVRSFINSSSGDPKFLVLVFAYEDDIYDPVDSIIENLRDTRKVIGWIFATCVVVMIGATAIAFMYWKRVLTTYKDPIIRL
jgi:hypothetical protein